MSEMRKRARGITQAAVGLAAVAGSIALLLMPVWLQPEFPGRWCESGLAYSECYRAWLGALSGWMAALGAVFLVIVGRMQIDQARELAHEQRQAQKRAMLMALASKLENLSRTYNHLIYDIDNWFGSEGQAGTQHSQLPVPDFALNTADLEALPPIESQQLLRFGGQIVLINDTALARAELDFDPNDAAMYIRAEAARCVLEAIQWHDEIAARVGWEPMPFTKSRKIALRKIVAAATWKTDPVVAPETD